MASDLRIYRLYASSAPGSTAADVGLITQRSQVQILSPLQRKVALASGNAGRGHLLYQAAPQKFSQSSIEGFCCYEPLPAAAQGYLPEPCANCSSPLGQLLVELAKQHS